MYREIKVGKGTVPMLANGATPIRYRMVFKKDLITEFQHIEGNYSIAVDTVSELAFILAKAAEKADMNKLNMETYIAWLEQFDPFDLTDASEAIIDLYIGNEETKSEVKKKARDAVKEN